MPIDVHAHYVPPKLLAVENWSAAVALDVPVFVHPAQPTPTARTGKFALNQIAQYTFDTTLCLGSLISAGVLDRFPKLRLVVSVRRIADENPSELFRL